MHGRKIIGERVLEGSKAVGEKWSRVDNPGKVVVSCEVFIENLLSGVSLLLKKTRLQYLNDCLTCLRLSHYHYSLLPFN